MTLPAFQPLGLKALNGPEKGQCIRINRPIMVGRDPNAPFHFNDERVSRHHAMLDLVNNQLIVRDLGSKNGTYLNGREVTSEIPLRKNDQIRIGQTTLLVVEMVDSKIPEEDLYPQSSQETKSDSELEVNQEPETLKINRHLLHRSTNMTAHINTLAQTREPHRAIIDHLRKEFHADAAGIFQLDDELTPIFLGGDFFLSETERSSLLEVKDSSHNQAILLQSGTLPNHGKSLLAFPIWKETHLENLFLLRRDGAQPFQPRDREMADTLSECLRSTPIHQIFQEKPSVVLGSNFGIVGSNQTMNETRRQIQTFAKTDGLVLIRGESGTGKELCARAITQLSDRRFAPYVEVNCACMIPQLIEAELFGNEKGAFTGAHDRRLGKLELANGGTLFLDEIGEIPLDLQAKLLRILDGASFFRLGGNDFIDVDVRFICATNQNLELMVEKGLFRRDLYHRINVLSLIMPPLREHLEDIPELVSYLINQIQEDIPTSYSYEVTPKSYRRLLSHHWPGNVRELRNVLQRIMLLNTGPVIEENMLPEEIGEDKGSTTMGIPRLQLVTEMIERDEISRALTQSEGQKSQASRQLGISRPTLDKKIKQYNLEALINKRAP